jgi:hypothetical protein
MQGNYSSYRAIVNARAIIVIIAMAYVTFKHLQ